MTITAMIRSTHAMLASASTTPPKPRRARMSTTMPSMRMRSTGLSGIRGSKSTTRLSPRFAIAMPERGTRGAALISAAAGGYVSRMPFLPISHVPLGSQDLLADDVRLLRRIQSAWYALAEARGYEEVIPPTFEYEEVFTRGGGPDLASRLLRFVDQDGRLVALRADFTSS